MSNTHISRTIESFEIGIRNGTSKTIIVFGSLRWQNVKHFPTHRFTSFSWFISFSFRFNFSINRYWTRGVFVNDKYYELFTEHCRRVVPNSPGNEIQCQSKWIDFAKSIRQNLHQNRFTAKWNWEWWNVNPDNNNINRKKTMEYFSFTLSNTISCWTCLLPLMNTVKRQTIETSTWTAYQSQSSERFFFNRTRNSDRRLKFIEM